MSEAGGTRAVTGPEEFDVVIVGAGFAGMYMLHKVRELGLTALVFEAGDGVGGTWYWNRYPGARCDVDSVEYQFGFSDELQRAWTWSERYASQPEILRYQNYVADRLDLRRDMRFGRRVEMSVHDASTNRWTVTTDKGDCVSARYCIMAVGNLSAARVPDIAGLDDFAGDWYHTGDWPRETVDFRGKRVAVIGTGSSGTQAIPEIARDAEHLTVFQRTPNFMMPAFNAPLDQDYVALEKENFQANRQIARSNFGAVMYGMTTDSALDLPIEEAHARLEERWRAGGLAFITTFNDILVDPRANELVSNFVREKLRARIVDPELAEKLLPHGHPFGAKRPCLETDFLTTFSRPNVTLIDVNAEPIERITAEGVAAGGVSHPVDIIVFATGFDAMTGAVARIDIRGRDGVPLRQEWLGGPVTYLGLGVAGFPNMFFVNGPGSPSVLTNNVVAIEYHVDWIGRCLADLKENGIAAIEARPDAQAEWVAHANAVADATLLPQANSWYLGANVPGKPRVFMPYAGGFNTYVAKCEEVRANGYEGFDLKTAEGARAALATALVEG